ncbi:MAG: hypothetical protein GF355_03420 [Candidatus Eisenbacteria bacterium]|nr:hypothetical protein [Candidatus Eisenbacteria bacterium]
MNRGQSQNPARGPLPDTPDGGSEQRRTSLRDFLSVVFRRKGIIIAIVLTAVAAVLVVNTTTPTTFESYSSVLVSRGQPQSVFATGYKVLSWEEELNSEVEVIKSQQIYELATRTLEQKEVRDESGRPLDIDPTKIRATTPGKSSVINIAYRSLDPREARQITHALTRAYMDFRHQTRGTPELEGYFREQIEQLEEQMAEWERRRTEFMEENSVVSPEDERFFLLQEKNEIQSGLTDLRRRIAERQAQMVSLRRLQNERQEQPGLQILPFSNPGTREESVIDMLMRELTLRRSAYYEAAARYTENHPEVRSARRHVLDLEAALDRELDSYLRHLEARVGVLLAEEKALTEIHRALAADLASLPSKEIRLGQIDRVLDALQMQYEALVRSSVDARVKRTGSADWNVILLSPASEAYPVRMKDYVRLAILPLFSLILGIGLAFLVDSLDHSIKDAADIETYVGLPVLASVRPFGRR